MARDMLHRRSAFFVWLLLLAGSASDCGSTVPSSPTGPPNFAGNWTGQYLITQCVDINQPGLTPLGLCASMLRTLSYRFSLSETGATVVGTYTFVSPLFNCPCGGNYGTFDMSGAVAADGTLTISAAGAPPATGLEAAMTFKLNLTASSTLSGDLAGALTLGGVQRATFSGSISSGTRS
jgi:hypothetical protein